MDRMVEENVYIAKDGANIGMVQTLCKARFMFNSLSILFWRVRMEL